jgi:hypothetical protein
MLMPPAPPAIVWVHPAPASRVLTRLVVVGPRAPHHRRKFMKVQQRLRTRRPFARGFVPRYLFAPVNFTAPSARAPGEEALGVSVLKRHRHAILGGHGRQGPG